MTTCETNPLTTILSEIEDGYARVRRENGRSIGTVVREKHGSTRTGTQWIAYSGRNVVGYSATRAGAVEALVASVKAHDAQRAAFLASSSR